MATNTYYLGLITEYGAEPASSTGYTRQPVTVPTTGEYYNLLPILFCRARLDWRRLTRAGLYTTPSAEIAFITTPLLIPPAYTTPQALTIAAGEEAEIPPFGLYLVDVAAHTPRPFGRYRFGRQAFGTWPAGATIQFRVGARPLADIMPVACATWAAAAAPCAAWTLEPAPCAAWAVEPAYTGGQCR
jgi:hypothetical protein